MKRKDYVKPELDIVEIRAEKGFAVSTWQDYDQGTSDVWIDQGETDDEWA